MKIKKNDFIELNYTAKTKEGEIFDTTLKEIAPEEKKNEVKPLRMAVGKSHVLKGLDDKIEGLELGEHVIELKPEEAFGKKDAKKLKLMPMSLFKKQNIKPFPGLELNIDNTLGIVRSVSGGRVIVDFNHPLASKDIVYEVNILRKIEDAKEKAESLMEVLGIPYKELKVEDKKIILEMEQEFPEQFQTILKKEVKELLNKDLEFKKKSLNKQQPK